MSAPLTNAAPDEVFSLDTTIELFEVHGTVHGVPEDVQRSVLHYLRALKVLNMCVADPPLALGFPPDTRIVGYEAYQEMERSGLRIELTVLLPATPAGSRWVNWLHGVHRRGGWV